MKALKNVKNTLMLLGLMIIFGVFISLLYSNGVLTITNTGGIAESTLQTVNIFIWVFMWIILELL